MENKCTRGKKSPYIIIIITFWFLFIAGSGMSGSGMAEIGMAEIGMAGTGMSGTGMSGSKIAETEMAETGMAETGMAGELEILNKTLRDGALPENWGAENIVFETAAEGYARFETETSVLVTRSFDAGSFSLIRLTFDVAKYGGGDDGPLTVWYSRDGETWTEAGDSPTPPDADYLTAEFEIEDISDYMKLRFTREKSPGKKRLRDIVVTGIVGSIRVEPESLAGFEYETGFGPSPERSVTVSAENVTDDLVVSPPAGFEISSTTGESFTSGDIILKKEGGKVAPTEIFVRLKAGLSANRYSGDLMISGGGAVARFVSLSGEVRKLPMLRYEFTGETSGPAFEPDNATASELRMSSGSVGFGSSHSDEWSGSGVPYAEASGGWGESRSGDAKYFSFTLEPDFGHIVNLTGISFEYRATGAGPSAMTVTVNEHTVIEEIEVPADENLIFDIPLEDLNDLSEVEVRIKGWDNHSRQTSGGGAFRLNDVRLDGEVVGYPRIQVVPTEIQNLDYVEDMGPSLSRSFDVQAHHLTSDLSVFPPANFEVSLKEQTGFTSEALTLDETEGSVTKTIHVRLREGLTEDTYTGEVEVSGGGADAKHVSVDGNVSEALTALAPEDPYSENFRDFVSIETLPADWSVDYGGEETEITYEGDWGAGTSSGLRGNDTVLGFQHTGDTDIFTATLSLVNNSENPVERLFITYTGKVERSDAGRSPEWTVTVDGLEVPALAYSTEDGEDNMVSAVVEGLYIPEGQIVRVTWSSDRREPSGASKQIGISDVLVSIHETVSVDITGNAGWRMLSLPAGDIPVSKLAAHNQIQGFDGANDFYHKNGYPDIDFEEESRQPNFLFYGSEGWKTPDNFGSTVRSGQGFIWYFWNNDTGPSVPLNEFSLSVSGASPVQEVRISLHEGWNLIGNPFTSDLILDELSVSNGTLQDPVYVWNSTAAGDEGGGDHFVQLDRETDNLAPWQGVFVDASEAAELTIPVTARSGDTGAGFYKQQRPQPKQENQPEKTQNVQQIPQNPQQNIQQNHQNPQRKVLAFELAGKNPSTGVITRDRTASLLFHEHATGQWDRYDGRKPVPLSESFALLSFVGIRNGEAVLKARESRPLDLEGTFEIPVSFDTRNMGGKFTISWNGMADLPDSWNITLVDNHEGQSIDLRKTDTYRFSTKTEVAESKHTTVIKHKKSADNKIATDTKKAANTKITGVTVTADAETSDIADTGDFGRQTRFTLIVSGDPLSGDISADLPEKPELAPNYPNPFNPATVIAYSIPEYQRVSLSIYDILGREIAVLVDEYHSPGNYKINWDASHLSGGVYLYRLEAGGQSLTRHMTLVK